MIRKIDGINNSFMNGKYKVITLCGSTRFKDQFIEVQKRLTLEGNIVISVGLFGHSGDYEVWSEGTKEMLDDMHKRKIEMADEIFVINVGGYIGSSTKSEIEFARRTGKTVRYLEDPRGNRQTLLSRYIDVKSNFFFSTFKKFSFQLISAVCIQHKVGHFCYSL